MRNVWISALLAVTLSRVCHAQETPTVFNPGGIRVVLEPPEAVAEGALWQIVGESTWRFGGTVVNGLAPGAFEVEFASMLGWSEPSTQKAHVVGGGIAELGAVYDRLEEFEIGEIAPQVVSTPDSKSRSRIGCNFLARHTDRATWGSHCYLC